MENSLSILPLFPLQIVLLPGSVVPLHVFEERYKILVRECAMEQSEFGINLVLGGRVHRIGCTAMLEEIIRRYPDGRLDIRVRGNRRYKLTEDFSAEDTPYFVGKVSFIPEEPSEIDHDLTTKAQDLLDRVIQRVYKGKDAPPFLFQKDRDLSYQMAEYSGLDFSQRQVILECSNERKRIQILISHYERLLEKLTKAHSSDTILDIGSSRLN
jgi:Lon protease-like protein